MMRVVVRVREWRVVVEVEVVVQRAVLQGGPMFAGGKAKLRPPALARHYQRRPQQKIMCAATRSSPPTPVASLPHALA